MKLPKRRSNDMIILVRKLITALSNEMRALSPGDLVNSRLSQDITVYSYKNVLCCYNPSQGL